MMHICDSWHNQVFNLWDVPPPPVPSVVLSVRRRTPEKNVGRYAATDLYENPGFTRVFVICSLQKQ